MAETSQVRCIADVKAVLGEGPIWDERDQALYWVDIAGGLIFRWSEANGVRSFDLGTWFSALAPRASGGFVAAGQDGFVAVDLDAGRVELIHAPEPALASNRLNDGKTDRQGRFWAGTMDRRERESTGSLYRLDPDLRCSRIESGYRVSNGPAFSLDGRTLYHSDSAVGIVYAFDLGEDGAAANRRIFARFDASKGYPDGMTVDCEGHLWIAFWDGWCLRRLSPSGVVVAELPVPVQRPTSVAFGGEDYRTLFMTSARRSLSDEQLVLQPDAGGLFVTVPGVPGVPETPFAG